MKKNLKEYPVKTIKKTSKDFPQSLLSIKDCPEFINVIGDEKILNMPSISIVGTRFSTELGNSTAYNFGKEIAKTGLIVVSGMAYGIDQNAHLGAVSTGKTIAIIAGGFNIAINSGNFKIAQRILDSGGCIITEYGENTPPQDFTFILRNRLIAGISMATIVIEAPIKSGAMSTAKYALDYNKPLYAIPYSLNSFKGKGCNLLLQNGAKALIDPQSIISSFTPSFSQIDLFTDNKKIRNIPDEYLAYYEFIKENAPVSEEQITSFFYKKCVSDITSDLTMMELNDYIKFKDNLYFI